MRVARSAWDLGPGRRPGSAQADPARARRLRPTAGGRGASDHRAGQLPRLRSSLPGATERRASGQGLRVVGGRAPCRQVCRRRWQSAAGLLVAARRSHAAAHDLARLDRRARGARARPRCRRRRAALGDGGRDHGAPGADCRGSDAADRSSAVPLRAASRASARNCRDPADGASHTRARCSDAALRLAPAGDRLRRVVAAVVPHGTSVHAD